MQPLVYGSGDIAVIGYALGGFFLLNVLPGAYVAQPDPFLFANITSDKNLTVIDMAESGGAIQAAVQQSTVVPGRAAPGTRSQELGFGPCND